MSASEAIRIIWTDKGGLRNPYAHSDLADGVYAIVGPIADHTAEPEFQDALCVVAVRRNRRHGHLSFGKFVGLLRAYLRRGKSYIR